MQTIHTLSNGIRILHIHRELPVAYIGVAIDVGTRDEQADENGMAHFVEHMMFKGTKRRRPYQIINYLESVGGQMDAYTTKEDTYVYSVLPVEYSERAIELMADLVLNSTFPESELEKERLVVLDEIDSYKDTPSELIFDEFDEKLFRGQSIGRPILGTENSLESFDSARMKSFTDRCYTANRILLFALGSMSEDWLVRKVEKYFSSASGWSSRAAQSIIPFAFSHTVEKDTNQVHCIIGTSTPQQVSPERYKMVLLNNILGGPNMSSLLNMAVREKYGYCYTIESSLTGYTDTGVWTLYFGCDERNFEKAHRLSLKCLERICENQLSDHVLAVAKRQLRGQVLISRQNVESYILGISKTVLHNEPLRSSEDILAEIDTYTSESIMSTAQSMFSDLSTLIYK
ncbi:MAG: insulinase family protein [Paludibacteraceae bacterium]|nr:insulinase family protein [Paludibacteraceae bacterium]